MRADEAHVVIGQRVTRLRTNAGMLQPQLAQKMETRLGRSYNATLISRLERGQRPLTVNELIALADIFGVSEQSLIMRQGPIDIAAEHWRNREHDYAELVATTRGELRAAEAMHEQTARLAHALRGLHDHTSTETGNAENVAEYLQEVAFHVDRTTTSTPASDRLDMAAIYSQLGVESHVVEAGVARSKSGSAVSVLQYVLAHHDFSSATGGAK